MYAIRNKRTGKWLFGTDYRGRKTQRTSHDQALTWDEYMFAESDFKQRGCGKDYEIVKVKMEAIE